jgi:anti-sigma B factor antagonist
MAIPPHHEFMAVRMETIGRIRSIGSIGMERGTAVTNTVNSPVQGVACFPSHAVITLAGELDLGGRERMRDALNALLDGGHHRIVVDMTDVTFCDSTGLGILVAAGKRAVARDGWLRLTTPAPRVARVFTITGMNRLFPFYPDVARAAAG